MKLIPWVKTEEMEFIDGELLLAIKKHPFSIPQIVRSFGNDKVEHCFGKYEMYQTKDFDYYAIITNP
jgi:hypothetical protein